MTNEPLGTISASLHTELSQTQEPSPMNPKNTVCLWFDKDAEEAAHFYSTVFPDSKVKAVHQAPGDYPTAKRVTY
jgi:hypothetical protein